MACHWVKQQPGYNRSIHRQRMILLLPVLLFIFLKCKQQFWEAIPYGHWIQF